LELSIHVAGAHLRFVFSDLAEIEVRSGNLRYRRLFRWRPLSKGEIVDVRVDLPHFVGSLRLHRFVFPWGRLYFVLDQSLSPFRTETPLLLYFQGRGASKDAEKK
jgi:hypothetical protein